MISDYNHNKRIQELEKKVRRLEQIIESAGLLEDFVDLSRAAKILDLGTWTIRRRVQNDPKAISGKHYTLNGNRLKINLENWQKLIESDAEELKKVN